MKYDVKSVLISGWNKGGHDNLYPYYEPDERLGTWEELEAGIRKCHEMGLKVYFFVNFQPVDNDTDWYRRELHQYCIMDPWGGFSQHGVWYGNPGGKDGRDSEDYGGGKSGP